VRYAIEMGLRWHDTHTKFHKDWFSHSKVDRGGQTHRHYGDPISLFLVFQNKERRLKIDVVYTYRYGPDY
jgi:hypothetical protein